MEQITIALVLLTAVVISGVIARASPLPIPLPLVQIAFGAVIVAFHWAAVVISRVHR